MPRNRLSLDQSILAALACCAVFTALLVGSAAWWHAGAAQDRQRADYGSTFAAQLAAIAVEPMMARDRLRLDAMVDRFAGRPEIAGAAIYDLDNRLLAEVGRSLPRPTKATNNNPGVANASINFGDSEVGYVRVHLAADAFGHGRNGLLPALLLAGCLALAAALLAGVLLGRRLSRWLTSSLQGIEQLLAQDDSKDSIHHLLAEGSADQQLDNLASLSEQAALSAEAALSEQTALSAEAALSEQTALSESAAAARPVVYGPRPEPLRLGIVVHGLSRWPAGLQAQAVQTMLQRVQPVARLYQGQVVSVSSGLLGHFPGGEPEPGADDSPVLRGIGAALLIQRVLRTVATDLGVNADDIRLGLHRDDDKALLLAAMAHPGTIAVHPGLWHDELDQHLQWRERRSAALAALGEERCCLVEDVLGAQADLLASQAADLGL